MLPCEAGELSRKGLRGHSAALRHAPSSPLGHLPREFTLKDEIYQIKDFSRKRVRVLLRLDAGKVDLTRKGVSRNDRDFAVIRSQLDEATIAAAYAEGRAMTTEQAIAYAREV